MLVQINQGNEAGISTNPEFSPRTDPTPVERRFWSSLGAAPTEASDLLEDLCWCWTVEDFDIEPADYDAPSIPQPRRTRHGGFLGLIRYPGGKGRLLKSIIPRLVSMFSELGPESEYREPFLGGGAVALGYLKGQPRPAWLNDCDVSLSTLWDVVIHDADSLQWSVNSFDYKIESDHFYYYQRILKSIRTPADADRFGKCFVALAKIASHQLSFSGLGTCAGGPMGGRHPSDPDAIRSRFNPDALCSKIDTAQAILASVPLREGTCTCLDYGRLFEPGDAGFYLDPPYYQAGPQLYQFSFMHEDHVRLAGLLRRETRPWLLSYDDHPVIRELYQGWSRIEEVVVGYSINGCGRKIELLISSR